jgi:hypothetical protein
MNLSLAIDQIQKESQLWVQSLDTSHTELLAIKESIREIYNVDNRIAGQLLAFEGTLNNLIVKTKDLIAKIKIQKNEALFITEIRIERFDFFKLSMEKLKIELKQIHLEHIELKDRFFNEIIL